MMWKHWPAICLIPIVAGVVAIAAGQVAALTSGQFARGGMTA